KRDWTTHEAHGAAQARRETRTLRSVSFERPWVGGRNRGCDLGLPIMRNLSKHFCTHREDEGESKIALHPTDRNADQIDSSIENAAARYTGVAVSQACDEAGRCSLADITGRYDNTLRVVVAEAKDRISEFVAEGGVDLESWQIEVARLDDCPVAGVHL